MGGIFSKGGGSSQPAPEMPDYGAMMDQQMMMFQEMMGGMMEMMGGMMESMPDMNSYMDSVLDQQLQMPEIPSMLDMPTVQRDPEIDWEEKQDQLSAKARADYNRDEMLRKGRTDTIHTSPLLDEEDATVTGSIIAGS